MIEGTGGSWLELAAALYFGTLLHEDVAILAGSFLVVEQGFPRSLALIALYLGIVSGDLLLYGLGRAARRSAFFQRLLIGRQVKRLHAWLDRNLVMTVVACRVLPGTVFPVFVACGWFGLSFRRFLATTAVSSLVYTAALLSIVIALGEAVITHLGAISWAAVLAALVAAVLFGAFKPGWSLLPKILRSVRGETRSADGLPRSAPEAYKGMPPIEASRRPASLAERIPPPLFYVPIAAQWIGLGLLHRGMSLPTVTNPLIQAGGLLGESKSHCLRQVAPHAGRWFARFTTVTCPNGHGGAGALDLALAAMAEAGLDFPIVAKPDIGWRGFGVRLVPDAEALGRYLAGYPRGETVILQENIDHDGEVGIFYVRMPDEPAGAIFSLTFRYFPHVIGDGRSTVRQLIGRDARTAWKAQCHQGIDPLHGGVRPPALDAVPEAGEIVRLSFIGSNRVGGLYRDASDYVTPDLTARVDEIAKAIPEFYFGRFDARFRSIDALMRGEDFRILEINGAGSEAIHVWDPDMTLSEVYGTLFRQQSLMFRIARRNRERGFKPIGIPGLYGFTRLQQRLIPQYPPSG